MKPSARHKQPHCSNTSHSYGWRRVVYDEAHEFTCEPDTPGGLVWTMPLRCLRARSRWALTGTPPVYAPPLHFPLHLFGCADVGSCSYDLRALQRLGLLLGVDIGSCSAAPARVFVRNFFRSSERSEAPCAAQVVVDVPVQLSAHELIIARAFKFDNAGSRSLSHRGAPACCSSCCCNSQAEGQRRGRVVESAAAVLPLRPQQPPLELPRPPLRRPGRVAREQAAAGKRGFLPALCPELHAPTSFIVFIRNCWSGSTPGAAPALCSATQSGDPSSSSTTRSECR